MAPDKTEIRKRLTAQRQTLSPRQRQQWDADIVQRLSAYLHQNPSKNLVLYATDGSEPDVSSIEALLPDTVRVAYPAASDSDMIEFRYAQQEELVVGKWGIKAPPSKANKVQADDATVVMPAVGVSEKNGARVGRGGGHYDKVLSTKPSWRRVATVYDFQVMQDIEAEPHDQAVDIVITPTRTVVISDGVRSTASLLDT